MPPQTAFSNKGTTASRRIVPTRKTKSNTALPSTRVNGISNRVVQEKPSLVVKQKQPAATATRYKKPANCENLLAGSSHNAGVTLSRYMMELAHQNPAEMQEIESIFSSLQTATKTISNLVRRSHLMGTTGQAIDGNINVQGEEQKKLDIITNDVLTQALQYTGKVSIVASEEEDVPVVVDNNFEKRVSGDAGGEVIVDHEGRFTALFDPLDGSANVDASIPTGTIFGIFKNVEGSFGAKDCPLDQNTLQPGRKLVAAGYCLYSSSTTLVFSLGEGVHGFTLDDTIGEFVLTHPDIQIPVRGKICSFNQGNYFDWDFSLQDYIRNLQLGLGETQTRYSSRYIGSMAADIHRTLLYGGIFGYPADSNHPKGKLRLLYEAAPMAFLVEQAGGRALSGETPILDLQPESIHQRVPCVFGSRDDVLEMRKYYDE